MKVIHQKKEASMEAQRGTYSLAAAEPGDSKNIDGYADLRARGWTEISKYEEPSDTSTLASAGISPAEGD